MGASVAIGLGAGALSGAASAAPAPPGKSEAVAAEIQGLLAVGKTSAEAGESSGQASGTALQIGSTVVSGGTQEGTGESGGSLFDTDTTPLGRLQLAPWAAEAVAGSDSSSASSSAALLRLMLVNSGVLDVNVLQTESSATWSDSRSTSSSSSDGATVSLGDQLELVLLHSEANSEGTGSSYVLGVNDTRVLTSDQAGTRCALDLPVAQLNCLSASGGTGTAAAEALGATVGNAEQNLVASVVSASGTSGSGDQVLGQQFDEQERAVGDFGNGTDTGRGLAATGSDSWFWATFATAAIALGAVLRSLRKVLPVSS